MFDGDRTTLHPHRPQISVTRPTYLQAATQSDVMVTPAGRLRFAPLLLATMRHVVPGARVAPRHHAGIQIVTVMLGGSLVHGDALGGRATLGPDDICLRSTGSGVEHGAFAASVEPVRALELWLTARADVVPWFEQRTVRRTERLGRLFPIAGRGSDLAIDADVGIGAGVLAVGTSMNHRVTRRSYLVSTVGRISIDGTIVEPGARVVLRGPGIARITAIESTEVVTVSR
jgi:redox-sensitive bicupin YhaK (pirin superfamily)